MILADKIVKLRKKKGWSQEELAEKLNVSRQAVSKWEAAQTTPDLDKILQLGKLFGVTTDYLLQDEIECVEFTEVNGKGSVKMVALADANEYLKQRKDASVKIAVATFLCILSIMPLLILCALSGQGLLSIAEKTAVGIGVVTIFPIVAIAVFMFVRAGLKNEPFEFLESEPFEIEHSVSILAKTRQKAYRNTYMTFNCIGVLACILSPVPLLCGAFTGNDLIVLIMLCVTLLLAGIGAMFFIIAGVRWASTQKLLKEGEFNQRGKTMETIGTLYWLLVTGIYIGWSFITNAWHITWVIWPIAAFLFAVIKFVANMCLRKKKE